MLCLTALSVAKIVLRRCYENKWLQNIGRMILSRENRSTRRETLEMSTWNIGLELNQDLRSERPTGKRPSHDTASCIWHTKLWRDEKRADASKEPVTRILRSGLSSETSINVLLAYTTSCLGRFMKLCPYLAWGFMCSQRYGRRATFAPYSRHSKFWPMCWEVNSFIACAWEVLRLLYC
jgi:hypothetical protein